MEDAKRDEVPDGFEAVLRKDIARLQDLVENGDTTTPCNTAMHHAANEVPSAIITFLHPKQ